MMRRNSSLLIWICVLFCGHAASQTVPAWKITKLDAYIKQSGTPVIVTFWATYCVPCMKELPYFEETIQRYKKDSVKILLVSLDMKEQFPGTIRKIMNKLKFASPVVWLNETDADYFCPKIDTTWSGALPSTLFVNNKTGYHKFFEEELSREKFDNQVKEMIKE